MKMSQRAEPQLDLTRVYSLVTDDITRRKRFRKKKKKILGKCDSLYRIYIYLYI